MQSVNLGPMKWHREAPGVYRARRWNPIDDYMHTYRVISRGSGVWEARQYDSLRKSGELAGGSNPDGIYLNTAESKPAAQQLAQDHIDRLWREWEKAQ